MDEEIEIRALELDNLFKEKETKCDCDKIILHA